MRDLLQWELYMCFLYRKYGGKRQYGNCLMALWFPDELDATFLRGFIDLC